MSRYEDEEFDRLDVETKKLDGHGKKEEGFHHRDRQTEEDHEDEETEENDANHNKESSISERHEERKDRDRSPTEEDRYSFHAHNTAGTELEEAEEHVDKERDTQPGAHDAADAQASLQTSKAEHGGKTDAKKRPAGGHSDEIKEDAKLEKPKRDNWRQTKSQSEVKMNGGGGAAEGQPHHSSPHGRSATPAAPKKVADKVHSIIEDYTTRMKNNRPEAAAADRTFVRVGSMRGSESDPKGNISEIRARIERSASSVHTRPPPRRSVGQGGGGGGARDAESIDEREIAELEAKRKKKAEDWLNKFAKPADGGSHVPPDRSGPLSTPGKSQTSTWKKRELELQKEREEREAAQKQLDEKKKKLDEERRNLRKLKEQDDATKREQHNNSTATTPTTPTTTTERQSFSHHKYNTQEAHEKTSRSVQSPGIRSSPLIKSLSISSEDEKLKKQKAIESRLKPLNLDGLDKDELEKKAHELYERVRRLEEDKYDLEILLDKRESELNELKVKTGDAKGKFVKPQLKKVIKKDEGAAERDDVSFSAKLKADDDDEPKITATTNDHLTRMTSTSDHDDRSDSVGRRDDATNHHQHPQPPVQQMAEDSGC